MSSSGTDADRSTAEKLEVSLLRIAFLTPERTGLTVKMNNAVVKLLQAITSPAFSDTGRETQTGKQALGRRLGRDPRSIARHFKAAETLGLIESEKRFGERGRELSSRRVLKVSRLIELTKDVSPLDLIPTTDDTHTATDDTGPMTGDTHPVTPVTPSSPCSPDSSKQIFGSKGQTGSDQNFSKRSGPTAKRRQTSTVRKVTESSIQNKAAELFAKLRYRGDAGQTIWIVSAALHAGLLSECEVAQAIDAVVHTKKDPRSIPAYFRKVLADKAGLSLSELTELLNKVRITPRCPKRRPNIPSKFNRRSEEERSERSAKPPQQFDADELLAGLLEPGKC